MVPLTFGPGAFSNDPGVLFSTLHYSLPPPASVSGTQDMCGALHVSVGAQSPHAVTTVFFFRFSGDSRAGSRPAQSRPTCVAQSRVKRSKTPPWLCATHV